MSTGRILRFDEARGYGFIVPDEGGEDVFLHANALTDEKRAYRPGAAVTFDVLKDARGLKAMSVRIINEDPATARPVPVASRHADADQDDDVLCDVLSAESFRNELIKLCLDSVPSLTGEQIKQLGAALTVLGRQHGWLED